MVRHHLSHMNFNEMRDKIVELDAKLTQIEGFLAEVTKLDIKSMNQEELDKTTASLYRYETALRSALRLAKRMGLPEEMEQQITTYQRVLRAVHQLEMAYHALQVARMAAGDPIAWVQFGITATAFAFNVGEQIYDSTVGT